MCDYSEATDDVLITDDSQVRGYAHLSESVQILDSSMAFERCELKGCVQMSGRARAAVVFRQRDDVHRRQYGTGLQCE